MASIEWLGIATQCLACSCLGIPIPPAGGAVHVAHIIMCVGSWLRTAPGHYDFEVFRGYRSDTVVVLIMTFRFWGLEGGQKPS